MDTNLLKEAWESVCEGDVTPTAFYKNGVLYELVPGKWVCGTWVDEHYEPVSS